MTKRAFAVETSVNNDTGDLLAVYLRVRDGEFAETREVVGGVVNADYDSHGCLLGVELLGACDLTVLEGVTTNEPEAVRHFLRAVAPRGLVPA